MSDTYTENIGTLKTALSRAGHWASQHARVVLDKFELIHQLPRYRDGDTAPVPQCSPGPPRSTVGSAATTGRPRLDGDHLHGRDYETHRIGQIPEVWLDRPCPFLHNGPRPWQRLTARWLPSKGSKDSHEGPRACHAPCEAVVVPALFYAATDIAQRGPGGGPSKPEDSGGIRPN